MIDYAMLERSLDRLRSRWEAGKPFHVVTIDGFARSDSLETMLSELPDPQRQGANKSRDYMFAKNKYEKASFSELGARTRELYEDFISERFRSWLAALCGRDLWVDRDFHGGGLHQGGPGSFLDMHVDFNLHPLHESWFRDLNVLLYLNRDWKPDYGGELKLKNRKTGERALIEPLFNRCVIMETRDYTLHGYDSTSFPPGRYRESVACYAYSRKKGEVYSRSTRWYPESGSGFKRLTGRLWPALVKVKGRIFGSGTAKNR